MRLLLLLILALPLSAQDVPMRFYGMAILENGPKWTKEVTIDEARKWCDSDPVIAAGRFQGKLWRWYSAKGIGILAAGK